MVPLIAVLLLASPGERVLFQPGGGELAFVSFPPFGQSSLTDGGELRTDGDRRELAGLFVTPLSPLPELDLKRGFSVELTLRLVKEVHGKSDDNHDGRDDRAGFSLIVLDQHSKGIELGFWEDRVWAQDDGKRLFSQAEGADVDTTQEHAYSLRFSGEQHADLAVGLVRELAEVARQLGAHDLGAPDPPAEGVAKVLQLGGLEAQGVAKRLVHSLLGLLTGPTRRITLPSFARAPLRVLSSPRKMKLVRW